YLDGRCDNSDVDGSWGERGYTARNRQRAPKSAAIPRTALFAGASTCGGPPSVQHTRAIYRHHSDYPPSACRVRESSDSKVYRHSREYRAGGGDGRDSLLGLAVGCYGTAVGGATYGAGQTCRRSASVLMSFVADAPSDATLGALWRNDCGTDDSLLAWS